MSSASPPGSAFRREAGASLRLALPLVAAQVAAVGMGTVDTILAGRLGPQALAAVAVGSNYAVLFFIFFMGVLMACSPIVAQRHGAGRDPLQTGAFLREALLVGTGLALLWWLALRLSAGPLLQRLQLPPDTTRMAVEFLHALSWSAFGFSAWFVLRYTAEGLGQPRPILLAGVVGLVVNALLAWGLLFGHWGLPALGAVGCGWATSIAALAMAATLALQYGLRAGLRPVGLFRRSPPRPGAGADSAELLRLGLPIGLILAAEAGLFVMAAMLMSQFGEAEVAAYQIALNFAALLFMIPLSVGLAATVRVGHAVGAGLGAAEVRYRGRVGMQLGLLNAASNALIMLLLAPAIVRLYTADAAIGALAVQFLWLAAAFQFFDAVQVTANGALRGIKDTRLPMLITVLAYWAVGFPVSWWLAFHAGLGPAGVWWGLTVGLAVAAAGLAARFRYKAQSA
ncbi:MATE family efflux transporter [Solimonas sp. K1W22B-7]|uniref:MATE family efflux transporter n=1 Tax=Solimonas sp. K1W22B-7 TaxID=2303331 RepID=UPI000E33789D|nr:MATE family efflux transporter [Solimonas sp. K1W22B-7]AXQ29872.1 MATE family efflux transporter [Solimonas sp. K1W22B-7]